MTNTVALTHVLYIDDEPDMRMIVQMALENVGGMSVVVADGGVAGIDSARATPPQIILLDVMMPGVDGPETFARLRDDARTANVPVVFLTGKEDPDEISHLLDLGAAGVITKPFDPMALADQLRAIYAGAGADMTVGSSADAEHAAEQVQFDDLRRQYLDRVNHAVSGVDKMLWRLSGGVALTRNELAQLGMMAHGLAGTGAIFGYVAVSACGRDVDRWVEQALRRPEGGNGAGGADLTDGLRPLLESLLQSLRAAGAVDACGGDAL